MKYRAALTAAVLTVGLYAAHQAGDSDTPTVVVPATSIDDAHTEPTVFSPDQEEPVTTPTPTPKPTADAPPPTLAEVATTAARAEAKADAADVKATRAEQTAHRAEQKAEQAATPTPVPAPEPNPILCDPDATSCSVPGATPGMKANDYRKPAKG